MVLLQWKAAGRRSRQDLITTSGSVPGRDVKVVSLAQQLDKCKPCGIISESHWGQEQEMN
jgi:hypothetical protein